MEKYSFSIGSNYYRRIVDLMANKQKDIASNLNTTLPIIGN
jgi:hypothetical protein